MRKILNYGSLNIDMVYSVPHFVRPGETLAAARVELFPGGKGLNQSVALSRGGARVYHGGKIGADGLWLADFLNKSGADTAFVSQNGRSTGTAIIQVVPQGENSIIINHGANFEISPDEVEDTLSHFGKDDLLVLQNEVNDIGAIMKSAAAKGMEIALNPSPIDEALLALDLSPVTYLILNEIEGEALTAQREPDKICAALLEKYPNMKVILTLGRQGCIYRDAKTSLRQGIYKVSPVDTTAAGDTFTGFFLAMVCDGKPIAQALSMAAKAAALAVGKKGSAASIPSLKEVEQAKLEEVFPEVDGCI